MVYFALAIAERDLFLVDIVMVFVAMFVNDVTVFLTIVTVLDNVKISS